MTNTKRQDTDIRINGTGISLRQGESLLDAVKKLGLDSDSLAKRPIAAKVEGNVLSLNMEPHAPMDVQLLYYADPDGQRTYERTLLLLLSIAVHRLFPEETARLRVRYAIGGGLYVTLNKTPSLSEADVLSLEGEMRRLVRAATPLKRRRLTMEEALEIFEKNGQPDKLKLLKWRKFDYFDVYGVDDIVDYFYGEMMPDTGYADVFRLTCVGEDAFVLLLPRPDAPDAVAEYRESPKLGAVFAQSERWGELMECSTVYELNSQIESGEVRGLIRLNEALHERSYAAIADGVIERGARAVMVAGPSSSGKTTSANRIATQLHVMGHKPILLSLDNYYRDRCDLTPDENGEIDLEDIEALDIPRFNEDLERLLRGEAVETPRFDFTTQKRAPKGNLIQLAPGQAIIIEGIHGLNPRMLSDAIDPAEVFRVYVSALTTLNLDDHNRISTTDIRLLRRLVRDYRTRNAPMEQTLSMWASVRRGEEKWIFPFQENADVFFNTTLVYEIAALKPYVYPLLKQVSPDNPYYTTANGMVKFLNYFLELDNEVDEIPPTSILREFIGGCTFYEDKPLPRN